MPRLAEYLHFRLIDILKLPHGIGQPGLEDFGIVALIREFIQQPRCSDGLIAAPLRAWSN